MRLFTGQFALSAVALIFTASLALAADPHAGPDVEKMTAQVEHMREQMQALQKAKTPEERERILREHRQSMHEHMEMLCGGHRDHGMMGKAHGDDGMGCMGQPADHSPH